MPYELSRDHLPSINPLGRARCRLVLSGATLSRVTAPPNACRERSRRPHTLERAADARSRRHQSDPGLLVTKSRPTTERVDAMLFGCGSLGGIVIPRRR
jgi:hypothetical protein